MVSQVQNIMFGWEKQASDNVFQEDGGKKRDGMTYKIEDVPPWYVRPRNFVYLIVFEVFLLFKALKEGALRLPKTYDNHLIQPIPSHPIHQRIAVKTTSSLKI